jgi:hypothetical protein
VNTNPLFWPLLITFAAGVAGVGLSRLAHLRRLRPVFAAILFVVAYVAVYGKFFPTPRGATNKLFYAGLFGLALPLIPQRWGKAGALLALLPALWIAAPLLSIHGLSIHGLSIHGAGFGLVLILLLGALVLLRAAAFAASARPGAGALFWVMALALLGGAAPIALAGGSSTSLLLLLALVAGGAPWALAEFLAPQQGEAGLAFFWSGPISLATILLLVTGAEDGAYLLALVLLVLLLSEAAMRALARRKRPRLVVLAAGVALLLAALGVAGALYLAAPEAFQP